MRGNLERRIGRSGWLDAGDAIGGYVVPRIYPIARRNGMGMREDLAAGGHSSRRGWPPRLRSNVGAMQKPGAIHRGAVRREADRMYLLL